MEIEVGDVVLLRDRLFIIQTKSLKRHPYYYQLVPIDNFDKLQDIFFGFHVTENSESYKKLVKVDYLSAIVKALL